MSKICKYNNIYIKKVVLQLWKIRSYSYLNRKRPDFGLLYQVHGHIKYSWDGKTITTDPGDIIFLPKGTNYSVELEINRGEVKDVLINFDHMTDDILFDITEPTVIVKDPQNTLLNKFYELVSAFERNEHLLNVQSLLYGCLYSLLDFNHQGDEVSLFNDIARLLSEDNNASVNELCKKFLMSRSVIQKKFKAYFGCTPSQYKKKRKIEKAVSLLETTDMPMDEIASKLGFYDTAYFYKVFKASKGMTPAEYRKKVKIKI